jgi:sugar lactone lactonase YvrE
VKCSKVSPIVARILAAKLFAVAVAVLLAAPAAAQTGNLTIFAPFDPAKGELGENLAFDQDNNLFVSLVLSNEVRKITPEGVQSTYATFSGAAGSFTTGLVINDGNGDLFVAYDPAGENPVIYVVHPDQSKQVIATFPVGGLLNGMTPDDDGNLYITDSFAGVVWRVSHHGGTPVVWLDLHAPGSLAGGIGPNGVKFDKHKRNLHVTINNEGAIVRIPVDRDGQPGTPEVFASTPTMDDFCFDELGNLYLATQSGMSVLRIRPDGKQETIASSADGLQNTAAVLFGRRGKQRLDLYILSGDFPPPAGSHPGVYVLHVGLPGLPVSIPD